MFWYSNVFKVLYRVRVKINYFFLTVAVNSQTQRGTCFANVGCTGTSTQSGLVGDLMEHCCIYTNPGVTRGFSYQFFGIEQCFACPRSKFN